MYSEKYVKIINPLQAKMYLKNNIKPIDIYYNVKTDVVVFIFTVRETKAVYELWCERKLK